MKVVVNYFMTLNETRRRNGEGCDVGKTQWKVNTRKTKGKVDGCCEIYGEGLHDRRSERGIAQNE